MSERAPSMEPPPTFDAYSKGCLGVFWFVPDGSAARLLIDATTLLDAEPYGEFLTHPRSHHDVWSAWQALSPKTLCERLGTTAPRYYEYEDWPRGRIVFHQPTRTFTLYRDGQLANAQFINAIVQAFDLHECTWQAASDAHYSRAQRLRGSPPSD